MKIAVSPSGARRATQLVAWVIAGAFTLAVARFTLGYCYFIGDDFSTMWRFRVLRFTEVLLFPLGGQVVPLNRLVARTVDALAPASFTLAWAVLLASHAAGVFYLHRILQLLRPSPANAALVALYCVHPLFGVQLAWFSPGLTRLPYVALTLVAIHSYLRHRRDPSLRHLAVTVVAFLGALGFYSKGILTPLLCLALDVLLDALGPPDERARRGRRARLACVAVLVAGSVSYVLLARTLVGPTAGQINADPAFHAQYQALTWIVTLHAIVGRVLEFRPYSPTWIVPLVFTLAIGLSLYLRWKVWIAWVTLVLLVSASFGIIGASARTLMYGGLLAFEHRYHFEVMFIFVLCLGIVVHGVEDRFRELSATRGWLPSAAHAAAVAGIAALAFQSYRDFERTTRIYYADMPAAKSLVTTLLGDVRALRERGDWVVVLDGEFPRYLNWMDLELRTYSQLLSALGERIPFGPARAATHRIDSDGHVVRR